MLHMLPKGKQPPDSQTDFVVVLLPGLIVVVGILRSSWKEGKCKQMESEAIVAMQP